ncbi:HlyC/CorC family transporter [Acidihalobacter ferrooxydans]|uniref:Magnesium and cobalt efflux protein CorC n=1 Tax=Acidihalobacter ferrooxydans TaxID=1765967 RepID=A0A1P8UEP1_9GAMM|nr:transporter associated domain-containing protein [Acidihalobacter ferrooxydans]APZ42307.1 magnesium/cobalt efflux protein [Acidihalobacter ferrooxydans]
MDDRPSTRSSQPGWLERISRALLGEPQDREELVELLRSAHERQLLDVDALAMIEGVFEVADMRARDIMVPRAQMEVISRDDGLEQILEFVLATGHSRYPVVGDNRDAVIGVLLAKDLLRFCYVSEENSSFDLQDFLRPPVFVPESKRLNVLLKDFRRTRNHMAIVANEYGGVAGLVTIEDVLEQIVGDIDDEHDEQDDASQILPHEDGHYTVKALTPIEDFNDYFHAQYSDEEFDTIGGLLINRIGRVPKRGESVNLDRFRFRVLRADTRRVHLLELRVDSEGGEVSKKPPESA